MRLPIKQHLFYETTYFRGLQHKNMYYQPLTRTEPSTFMITFRLLIIPSFIITSYH